MHWDFVFPLFGFLFSDVPQVGKINAIFIWTQHEDIHSHHCHVSVTTRTLSKGWRKRAWEGVSEIPEISIQIQKPLVISDLDSNEHRSDLT